MREETGYQWIQGTRPQTLAFGLTDSPAGPCGMDRREIPRLVRLRRRRRARDQPGPHARRHLAVLVHRRDRLVVLALLCPASRLGDLASRRDDLGADRLCAIPARNPQTPALRRPRACSRTSAAGASCRGVDISRRWNSRSCSPTRCALSSGNCDDPRELTARSDHPARCRISCSSRASPNSPIMGSPVRLKATAPMLPAARDKISARRNAPDELWHSSAAPATGEPLSSSREWHRDVIGDIGHCLAPVTPVRYTQAGVAARGADRARSRLEIAACNSSNSLPDIRSP